MHLRLPTLLSCLLLGTTSLVSATNLRQSRALLRTRTSECTLMVSAALAIDPDSNDLEASFECQMNTADTNGIGGQNRKIEGTKEQMNTLKKLLETGRLVPGESTLNHGPRANFNRKKLFLPPGLDVAANVRKNKRNRRRLEGDVFGDKPILAVKVYDINNKAHADSVSVMSNKIFGGGGDLVNLKSQMYDCSMEKLNIVPGETPTTNPSNYVQPAPGMMEVTIDLDITTNDRYAIHNAVTAKVQEMLGISLPGPYEQVMYIVEKCYVGCGWAAYAYVNSWMSVYQQNYYKHVGVQMHEIGHNFGFAHSGGLDGQTYTDHTCLMGNPLYSDEVGKMCFNGAKNWQIGWYDDKKLIVDTDTSPNDVYTLVGVADYLNNPNQHPVVIKLETGTTTDYFIAFNRATGVNSQNDEADDEVTIVESGNNGESYSQSYLKATLMQGETYTFNNWRGGAFPLRVSATSIDTSSNPGTAIVAIELLTSPTAAPTPFSCSGDEKAVSIDITTDNYASETTWTLINECDGSTVKTGGPYSTGNTAYSEVFCVPTGEYTFTISDSFGDGICCSYGSGSYAVTYDGGLVASGGDFTTSEVTTFGSCGVTPTNTPTKAPTSSPTASPTKAPTKAPTKSPTKAPTSSPSSNPSSITSSPTVSPTKAPTKAPTSSPSASPTKAPTKVPTPSTTSPTALPTRASVCEGLKRRGCRDTSGCRWFDGLCIPEAPSPATSSPTVGDGSCIYSKRNPCIRNGCTWANNQCS